MISVKVKGKNVCQDEIEYKNSETTLILFCNHFSQIKKRYLCKYRIVVSIRPGLDP